MTGELKAVILGFIIGNAWTLFLASQSYTEWSIRTRNQMYYQVLGRDINQERAERAGEIAEDVVKWLRPLLLCIFNLAVAVYVVKHYDSIW